MNSLAWLLGSAALLLSSGCDTVHHARVDNGAGLVEGSGVMVSGVRVGSVREIHVVQDAVDVGFVIDDGHDVTLREDSCALAVAGESEPTLVVMPGVGDPLTEPRALPQCELPGGQLRDLLGSVGDTLGGLLRSLGSGLSGGGSSPGGLPPIPGLPSPPPNTAPPNTAPPNTAPPNTVPAPPSFDGRCDGLSLRIDSVRRQPPSGLRLRDGGHRVCLEFRNDAGETMRVGSRTQATFVDQGRRALSPVSLPSDPEVWFMPFDVPANGTARRCVIFEGSTPPQLDEVESRRSAPAANPLAWCTLRGTGLAAP